MGLPAALIASWPLAACDDDSAGPAGDDTMTDEEVVALVDGLTAVAGLIGADAATPVVDQPAVQCPMAGTMGFSARVTPDSTATTRTIRTELVVTPQNRRFTARGATFTANGAPDVRQVGEVTIVGLSERVGGS